MFVKPPLLTPLRSLLLRATRFLLYKGIALLAIVTVRVVAIGAFAHPHPGMAR
jgi:hypothetical protein